MKKDDFMVGMNEEQERRAIVMNGEKMELGDDGEYHVVREKQFGRLSKLHAIGACFAAIFVIVALAISWFTILTGPKSMSETASECEYSDELCLDEVGNKDPEILKLRPDEVDVNDYSDDVPSPSYETKGDLGYSKPPKNEDSLSMALDEGCYYYDPALKDPEANPTNDDTSTSYKLTIRYVDIDGYELLPSRVITRQAGDRFSESVPHIADHQPDITQITGIMPRSDLVYTVRYYETPSNLPPSSKN